jgi:enoyl-CoA hydratase
MPVEIEAKDGICTIIINRPEAKNAIDGPAAKELANAFRQFEQDESLAVAVLWGQGGTFCAGADLKALADPQKQNLNRLESDGDGPMGLSRMMLNKPVIAAISGFAVAGGLELALWCDLRVMEETGVMGVFCRRFGVPLIDGGTIRLPRLIGMSRAMDLILTGRPVEAAEAKAMGLANRVVPHGAARPEAEALARQIAAFPQACMRGDRRSAYEQWGLDFEKAIQNEFDHGMNTIESGESFNGAVQFSKGKGRHGSFSNQS